MEWFTIVAVGILGVLIGSFLNVVVLRMNTGKGLSGRSICFSCGKTLSWQEIIPVISYFIQRRKCRSCRSPISVQYSIVEIVTGLLFAGVAAHINILTYPITTLVWFVLISTGVVIATYDILHTTIPQGPLLLFFIMSIILGMHGFGFVVVPLPFLLLWIVSRGKWIGFGDIKLMACIGVLLGTYRGSMAVIIAFWIACVVILPWYTIQKARKKSVSHEIPFGPFLLLSTYLVGIGVFDHIIMVFSMI